MFTEELTRADVPEPPPPPAPAPPMVSVAPPSKLYANVHTAAEQSKAKAARDWLVKVLGTCRHVVNGANRSTSNTSRGRSEAEVLLKLPTESTVQYCTKSWWKKGEGPTVATVADGEGCRGVTSTQGRGGMSQEGK